MLLSSKNLFLSPNHRLALFAARKYQTKVYTFGQWLEKLWQSLENDCDSHNDSHNNSRHNYYDLNDSHYPNDSQKYLSPLPRLLTKIEQLSVFEAIIKNSPLEYPLLRREATAKLVSEAWDLSLQWDLSLEEQSSYAQTEDQETYLQWARAYQDKCMRENWIDFSSAFNYLARFLQDNLGQNLLKDQDYVLDLQLPAKIICLGFGEWTPQQKRFLNICESKGMKIEMQSLLDHSHHARIDYLHENQNHGNRNHYDLKLNNDRIQNHKISEINHSIWRLGLANEEEEIKIALKNAKAWLNGNSKAKIGIIIPDLEKKRFAILRILKDICSPEEYNVSAPIPLIQYPMIDAAFIGLNLMQDEIPFVHLSKWLRLTYLGGGPDEFCQTAEFEVQLRYLVSDKHSLAEYVFFLETIQKKFPKLENCSIILKLKNCLQMRSQFFGEHRANVWKDRWIALLDCVGFPGSRPLSAEELALKKHWDELLNDYIKMDPILGEHSHMEALAELRRLATHREFLQPSDSDPESESQSQIQSQSQSHSQSRQSSIDAPIQVLGLLEGLGFPFDYLWVQGLSRDTWPMEPTPNPFISLPLQKIRDMPRSSAARELKVAERITEELTRGGKTVIFSYPLLLMEQPTTFSPLIADFKEMTLEEASIFGIDKGSVKPFEEKIRNPINSHDFSNSEKNSKLFSNNPEHGPALDLNEKVQGGTKILALQAVCPFRAFSEIRLKAEPLQNPHLGLTAAEKGEIIHQVLRAFWRTLKNQKELLALTKIECNHRILEAINTALQKWQKPYHSTFMERYLSIERNRIFDLISRFLEIEAKRPPFEVIAHEVTEELMLGGIRLKLRIDRIDKLENGDELLIDYKTGQVQISEWFGERPLSPQLPLYCIARRERTSAMAFAIIRPDEIRYKGLSKEATEIDGLVTLNKMQKSGAMENWELQNAAWETHMENLAQEFKSGQASIAPLKGDQSCRTCHLKSLCRWGF